MERMYRTGGVSPGLRAVPVLLALFLVFSPTAEAQYRGGRRPPKPPLQRKGLLYLEAGWFSAVPGQDFASPSGGAAENGNGLRIGAGSWIGPHLTVGFELALYTVQRFSNVVPYDLQTYDNITGMEFEVGGWQLQSRYHLNIRKRIMPYVVFGIGRVRPNFMIHFTHEGRDLTSERRQTGIIYAGGVGADIVLGNHATFMLEWRWMSWFGDWFIPGARYWEVQRSGVGVAWHF